MKKNRVRKTKKLRLSRETLKALVDPALQPVRGGQGSITKCFDPPTSPCICA